MNTNFIHLSAALLEQVSTWWIKTAAMYHSPEKHINNIREEDKAVITKSFDKLEAYKKKIGKCISKSMLQEFSKFSPKNILGL